MPPRKARIPVVFDTNVIIGYYLSKAAKSAGAKIFRLWRYERKLQLIVSDEVVAEYFEILARTGVAEPRVAHLKDQIQEASIEIKKMKIRFCPEGTGREELSDSSLGG